MKADVDPFPLVPAMCIGRNFLKSEGLKMLDQEQRISVKEKMFKVLQEKGGRTPDSQSSSRTQSFRG